MVVDRRKREGDVPLIVTTRLQLEFSWYTPGVGIVKLKGWLAAAGWDEELRQPSGVVRARS